MRVIRDPVHLFSEEEDLIAQEKAMIKREMRKEDRLDVIIEELPIDEADEAQEKLEKENFL